VNKRGSIEIIVVFGILAILASAALVMDFGMVAASRVKLQGALQNAALSGAHFLTDSETTARTNALNYFAANGEDPSLASVVVSNNNRRLEISSTQKVDFVVASAFGVNSTTISAKATAIIGPIKSISSGLRPLGVEKLTYSYGDQIILKEGAGSGVYGNYGSLALGGTGNSNYVNNLLYGYSGQIKIGDAIPTEPGNKAGAVNQLRTYLHSFPETFNNFSKDSNRLWTLPLIEVYDPNGRENLVVVGFAKFFIEDIQTKSGQAQITGRFVQFVDIGDVDPTLNITGLYGVKLIR
jgi:hypothetical protein